MRMSLDMCARRAAELHMSYGQYMASPQHREDMYRYAAMAEPFTKPPKKRNYPKVALLSVTDMQELLPVLRFKARINGVDFEDKDVSRMTRTELKAQINEIWRKI
ncbi:MAG: hypothetical protein MR038_03625 [Oscillospiraceae bacterium]|nr:hypothetical protein [Oscillospiraceae bacterium]